MNTRPLSRSIDSEWCRPDINQGLLSRFEFLKKQFARKNPTVEISDHTIKETFEYLKESVYHPPLFLSVILDDVRRGGIKIEIVNNKKIKLSVEVLTWFTVVATLSTKTLYGNRRLRLRRANDARAIKKFNGSLFFTAEDTYTAIRNFLEENGFDEPKLH